MFQNSPKINLAESLFTGLYVVVCRTEGTSDKFYHKALDFLNSELCSFNVANLIDNFLSNEDAEWAGDAFPFAAKLTLGPTQILWNTEPENGIPRDELLNASKARDILTKINAAAYAGQTGTLQIKYVPEESLASSHVPRLFYAGNVVATVVVNERDDMEFADLVDFYHRKKPLYGDERNLKFQFLVSKATPKFTMKVMAEYEKYIVKTNLYKYRKSKQFWGDDDLILDALILVDDARLVRQSLREVALSLATTFVALALEVLSRPENSLERVKRPAHHHGSSKPKNAPYKGAHVKNLGDLYKVLGNEDCAIVYYLAAAYYFSLEKNHLEQARALFCMVVAICRKFGFWHFLDSEYHSMFSFKRLGSPDGYDGTTQALGSDKHSSDWDNSLGGPEEDPNTAKEVPKKIREKPVEQIMHYTRRAYALWLKAVDNSNEFQILFAFFANMLLRAENPAIHEVVASYIAYADAMLTLEQRCNVLRYAMEAMKRRRCRRKVAFYGFLLDERSLELARKDGRATPAVDPEDQTGCAADDAVLPGHPATQFIVHNLNPAERRDVRSKFKHYEHWHDLKRAIAENEIRRLQLEGKDREVHRTVMLNFWNMLRKLDGATTKIRHTELASEVAALTAPCKGAETGHFKISHIVLSNEAGGGKQTPGTEVYDRLGDALRRLFVRMKGEDAAYAGGFEDLSFSKFPIAYSLKLPEQYFDYKYTRSTVPAAKREPRPGGSYAEFCMKRRSGRVRCNYRSIRARGFTDSITLDSHAGDDATGRLHGVVASPRLFEPRCTVVKNKAAGNTTCRVRDKSLGKYKGLKIERLSECAEKAGAAVARQGDLAEVTEEKVVFVDKALKLKATFRNPLPTDLELTKVEILGEGTKFEALAERVRIPAFAWKHTIDLDLVVSEPGILNITGIKFVLFDAFECTQLILDAAGGQAVEFLNGLVSNPDLAEDAVLQNLRDSALVKLNAVKDYKKSKVEVLFADFSHGSHESQIDFENGLIKLNDKFTDATSLSSLRSSRRSSNWTNNLDTQRSSVPWTNTSSPRGTCEFWNGLMVPNFGPGIAANELKLCGDPLCSWCTAFCHFHDKLSERCEGRLLTGEKKLMYARLLNENADHTFVNIRLSVTPTTHAPDETYRTLAKTAEDRERDRAAELKVQHLKRQIYSRYVVIMNQHCVKTRAENDSEPDHDLGQIVLKPNEAVYVPVVYRANQTLTKFNVIFDYDSVKSDAAHNYQEANLAIANAHKAVVIDVYSGIVVGKPRLEQRIEFNHRLLLRNIGQFKDVFSDATLQRLKRFKPVFDQNYAVAFVKVKNKTDDTFNCTIGQTKFVATPWSGSRYAASTSFRWPVTLRKHKQTRTRATSPGQVAKLAERLDLKWSLGPDRAGSIKPYDLDAVGLTHARLRSYVERERRGVADCAASNANRHNRLPEWYTANVQRLTDNAGILARSKLALKLATKLSGENVAYTRKSLKVPAGGSVKVDVLVANRGDRAVREYRVVVLPHIDMTYAQACALEWTGALEQVGPRPIVPRARAPKTHPLEQDRRPDEALFDDYTSVASVELRPTQRCDLAINAAVIVDRERTIYWHHEPVVVTVE